MFVDTTLFRCGLATERTYNTIPWGARVVLEKPGKQAGRNVKLDDLLTLARRVGWLEVLALAAGARVECVLPITWKRGSIPKRIHHPRILARLTKDERALLLAVKCALSAQHNVIDAIGIGLWAVGRM